MKSTPNIHQHGILAEFDAYGKPKTQWRLGGEFERIIVDAQGNPPPYTGKHGVRAILDGFTKLGWRAHHEGTNPISLTRDGASITLEPGGQVELSGAPFPTLGQLHHEIQQNRLDLHSICEPLGLRPLSVGLSPFCPIENISWMPKGRYEIMRQSMPGDLAHHMMKGTASVQCNYDYKDEADCAQKVKLAARLAPLTTAIFANSPLYNGKPTGWMSYRAHIWTRTDSRRTGFPPGLRDDYSHERWVDYLLDVPMMFYKSDNQWKNANGRCFREYLTTGIDGQFPTQADWELHMTSVFPEVRIKNTIEVRGADCVKLPMAVSLCALFAGLFYSEHALDEASILAENLSKEGERDARLETAARHGLGGVVSGRTLLNWAKDLSEIAMRGLTDWAPQDASLLNPLLEQIDRGHCPAVDLLNAWHEDPSPQHILGSLRY